VVILGEAWFNKPFGMFARPMSPERHGAPSARRGGTMSDIAGIDASGPDAQASADDLS
jgi:hypothetical protein